MCGIVGYVGDVSERQAVSVLLDGLKRLEYRGYDSAGLALGGPDGRLSVEKRAGRVDTLAEAVAQADGRWAAARRGIGHTRWATHGSPNDANAHPHADEAGRLAVVHNGIIENHGELRRELQARGHAFRSETDSEVLVHLLEEALADAPTGAPTPGRAGDGTARPRPGEGDALPADGGEGRGPEGGGRLRRAVAAVLPRLRGSFALAVLWDGEPDVLVGVRQQTPLIVGVAAREHFLASDVAALLPYTHDVVVLQDGEMVELRPGSARLFAFDGAPLPGRPAQTIAWDAAAAERGGYAHFMRKEIDEQPAALGQTLVGRLGSAGPHLAELDDLALAEARAVTLVACGSAHHAALVGAALLEAWARVPAVADVASEFRYRDPLVSPGDLAIAVSQSGETADTLAALREARARGALGVALVNVVGSTIAREADAAVYTLAGPEISVCSTKAYTTQLELLTVLALQVAAARGALPEAEVARRAAEIARLPEWAAEALGLEPEIRGIAEWLAGCDHCFFLGRGLDRAVALEGQLKLKEISYLHAEAYAAGELKHGTLALITEGTPVVAIFTQPALGAKTASNVAEVRARGAQVVGLATAGLREVAAPVCQRLLLLPEVPAALAPAVAAIPLQLLAYHTAVARGTDVDKPRNLAKSVTVE